MCYTVYGQSPPPVNCPPGQMPPFFATPVNSPLDKTPPRSNAPLLSNDPSRKWQREHVQRVLCCYCYCSMGAKFLRKNTHIKNIWYGNELSEYGTVQSTVLVDGWRYLTVVRTAPPDCCGNWRHQRVVVTTPASPA